MSIQLLITNGSGTFRPTADPIVRWRKIEAEKRFNEAGFGMAEVAATPDVLDYLVPGCRVDVVRDGAVWQTGRVEKPGRVRRAISGEYAGLGLCEIVWSDDLGELAGYITYPDPSIDSDNTAQPTTWGRTAEPAGQIITDLVTVNAGPTALTLRRMPNLSIASSTLGATIDSFNTRWQPLLEELRRLAILGGGLGFRVVKTEMSALRFEVYEPADLTATVRFSMGLRNLIEYDYDPAAPTVTVAIVGGEGEGADRYIAEVRNTAAAAAGWWRMEQFVDSSGTANAWEVAAAGQAVLDEGGETAALTCTVVDTPTQAYGAHFDLGDRVSIELHQGLLLDDVVRAVNLTASPREAERVRVLVGTVDASSDPQWVKATRNLARRVGRIEARR